MSTISTDNREKRKLNYRKMLTRLGALLVVLAMAIYGVFYFWRPIEAAVTNKPNVFIYDNGAGSNAAAIETALGIANYNITRQATMPSLAVLNTYDAVIFSAGTIATPIDATERTALNSYLNSGVGHLIIEGNNVLNSHVSDSIITGSILKLNDWSTNTRNPGTIRINNTFHPVTHLVSSASFGTNVRAFTSAGSNLASWNQEDRPTYLLSAWEGSNRKRLVFIGFNWGGWAAGSREPLIRNAVKWVSDFAEVELANRAPANVNPGTTNVKMATLKFSSYANSKNSNFNTITSFAVYQTGNAVHSSVSAVKLWSSNAAGDLVGSLPLAQAVFDANGKATFKALNLKIDTTDKYYTVTYDIASPADEAKTVRLRLADVTQFTTFEGGRIKLSISGGNESVATTINNVTPPAVPTQVYATNLLTGNSIRVGWKANNEFDFVSYRVYRAVETTGGKGAYSFMGTVATNIYNNTGLTEFNRYYYKITAYDNAGNHSNYSAEAMAIPNRVPATPTGLNVTNPGTGHKLNLTWNAVTGEPNDPFNGNTPDLAGYDLYAATNPGGPFTRVNETPIPATGYTHTGLKNGITYYYKVDTEDRYGLESPLSATFGPVTPTDSTPPVIASHYPDDGQDYVETNVTIKVKFDELLDTAGGISTWIKLEQKHNDGSYTQIPGTVSYNPTTFELIFKPVSNLATVGNFRVTVPGGAGGVKSYATSPFLAATKVWTFGTVLNPHVDFQTNNTLCGYCHSAHTSSGTRLIKQTTILELCFMCHDGTGSAYDVKAGKYFNGERIVPLAAGGYDLALGSTSTHFTDLANYVYGGTGEKMNIDCNSCHEPHGSGNFRNIRTMVNNQPVTLRGFVYGPAYSQKTISGYEVTTYVYGWEQFCATCHPEYLIYHSVTTNTGEENWRHRTGVPLTGGTTGGRWAVSFPTPGLYTTLPTLGAPAGANITNYTVLTGGTLPANTYNYIVTTTNAVGESVYGKILQVQNTTPNARIQIEWERIENAYKYRIYRRTGTGNPDAMIVSDFKLLAEAPDYPASFIDDGTYTPQTASPPMTSSAQVGCITCHFAHGTPAITENGEPSR